MSDLAIELAMNCIKETEINTLRKVRNKIESIDGIGKPRWEQGYMWMKTIALQDIDAMIAEAEKR